MTAQRKTIFIFLNPKAGLTLADAFSEKVLRWGSQNNWRILLHRTNIGEDYRAILINAKNTAQANGYPIDVVGAAGGDGTVSEVINAIVGNDIPLLIFPIGTANLFSMNFSIPVDPLACLNLLISDHTEKQVDLMLIDGCYRMMNAGVGFNSNLIHNTTREEKRRYGIMAYFRNIRRSLHALRQSNFLLTVDGEEISVRAAEVFITNVGLGFGTWIEAPEFVPDDGIISAYIIRPSNVITTLEIIKNLVLGKKSEHEIICHYHVHDEIRIESDPVLNTQADGEITRDTPLVVKVVPHSLRLITPVHKAIIYPIEYLNKYVIDTINSVL